MMGTFLNLVGAVRTLLFAIGLVAVAASCLGVFNTLLGSVLEQMGELSVMRALGASRAQVFGLVTLQAIMLALVGSLLGLAVVLVGGHLAEGGVKQFLPLAPPESLLRLSGPLVGQCVLAALGVGLVAGLYPAWQASRMQPADAVKLES
jgi:putative ABC transport system permease protein